MPRILITSGPTRQYLDPVRYLSNGSSGRMGKALAEAALAAGHDVVIVSGPVEVRYPRAAQVLPVVSTEDMLAACLNMFPDEAGYPICCCCSAATIACIAAAAARRSGKTGISLLDGIWWR